MTPLRQRMLEDMHLRGLSARTQECYVAAVRQLAEHYHRSPTQITEEDLRQYFLYLAMRSRSPAPQQRLPCAGSGSSSSTRFTATGRRCGSCVRPASSGCPWS